MRNRMTLTFV